MIKSNGEYWQETLRRYNTSKSIRRVRKKFKMGYKELSEFTGYSRQYINNVQEIIIKPDTNFINKLDNFCKKGGKK